MFIHTIPYKAIACLVAFLLLSTSVFGVSQWQEGDFVKLVVRDGAANIVNNHPLKISPQTISTLLSEIKLVAKGTSDSDDEKPLFPETKAKSLGAKISDAFRLARPNQDIAFQVMTISPVLGSFIKKPTYTAGRIFWRNQRLQIVFGSIQQGIAKRKLLGQERGIINPPEIDGRDTSVNSDYKPTLFPGSSYAETRSGSVRSNWLIINPRETLKQAAAVKDKMPTNTQNRQSDQRETRPKKYKESRESVEARLKYLKNLRKRNLISEENYRYKVRQIIDQL